MSLPSVANEPLVFNWDAPRRRNLVLVGFLVISFFAHAAGFYIFQIVYPPALSLLPPPAHVGLITSNSEEGRTVLRWLEAEDPALASSTLRPAEMKGVSLPVPEHIPSYLATEPALKNAPPLVEDPGIPSSQPPGPVAIIRPRPPQKIAVLPTTISFSKEIKSLGAPVLPALKFVASTNEAPQALSFRVAIAGHGEVLYCFPLNSSGDRDLDEQARKYLALCRFPTRSISSDADLLWGTATVEWGNDVALPQPESTATPTP